MKNQNHQKFIYYNYLNFLDCHQEKFNLLEEIFNSYLLYLFMYVKRKKVNVTKENINEHNPNLPRILDHSYRTLIIRGSRSGKTNALLNLIKRKMMMIMVLLIKFIYMLRILKI